MREKRELWKNRAIFFDVRTVTVPFTYGTCKAAFHRLINLRTVPFN